MRQSLLFAVTDEFDHVEDGFYDGTLEVIATFITEDAGEEGEHRGMFEGELQTERTDGIDDDDFELVSDFSHEACDLLHKSVDGCFVAGLKRCSIAKGETNAIY